MDKVKEFNAMKLTIENLERDLELTNSLLDVEKYYHRKTKRVLKEIQEDLRAYHNAWGARTEEDKEAW